MPYYLPAPPILRLRVLPEDPDGIVATPRRQAPSGKTSRRPHADAKVAEVRRLIEKTPLTYGEIAAKTGVGRASICRWTRDQAWVRDVFAPRATDTIPRVRAGQKLKLRLLAERLAGTRERAAARLPEFEQWLQETLDEITPEDKIDPQLYLQWQRSLPVSKAEAADGDPTVVEMTGSTGERGVYIVTPIVRNGVVSWIDPSGYELARSTGGVSEGDSSHRCDYEIHVQGGEPSVRRTYFGRSQ